MGASSTSVTVLGTACPWVFGGSGSNTPGAANTVVAFASGFNDGSTAGGGTTGQNSSFRYGQQHTSPSGETGPSTVAVTPGALVSIKYLSGTVATQAGGAGNSTPAGSSATIPTGGANETDNNGYSYPTNFIPSATTTIGGLIGCFTDSSGNVIANSFWDWKFHGGTSSVNSSIALIAPAGAAFLSLGIDDTILRDNTGSFGLTVFVAPAFDFRGDQTFFTRFPVGAVCSGMLGDNSTVKPIVFIAPSFTPLYDIRPLSLLSSYVGQLFPHGAQNSGGAPAGSQGQNFPY